MELIQEHPDIAAYLAADEAIDHEHPAVRETVAALTREGDDAYTYARTAFEYVRDTIPHSADSGDPRVTWRASDVLTTRNGICYAKSIALTALLRARAIPAGLCYQRLTDDDGTNPGVHGLVALRPPGHERWARVDPGATNRASTRSSRSEPSGWPGRYARRSARWTIRRSTPRRPPRSSTPCGTPGTAPSSGGTSPPSSEPPGRYAPGGSEGAPGVRVSRARGPGPGSGPYRRGGPGPTTCRSRPSGAPGTPAGRPPAAPARGPAAAG